MDVGVRPQFYDEEKPSDGGLPTGNEGAVGTPSDLNDDERWQLVDLAGIPATNPAIAPRKCFVLNSWQPPPFPEDPLLICLHKQRNIV